ncbi:MAG: hypothetical protein ACK53F_06590 [Betaproteobacteria bacterium]
MNVNIAYWNLRDIEAQIEVGIPARDNPKGDQAKQALGVAHAA